MEEIMNTNEVVTEEITTVGSNKAIGIAVGIGAAVLVGGLIHKFIVKPLIAKHRAKKNQKAVDVVNDQDVNDDDESED